MQHAAPARRPAVKPVAIEVDGEPLGVVVPDPGGYRFLAVRFAAFGIDGHVFESIELARHAASEAARQAAP
jgi:hypothetical protein